VKHLTYFPTTIIKSFKTNSSLLTLKWIQHRNNNKTLGVKSITIYNCKIVLSVQKHPSYNPILTLSNSLGKSVELPLLYLGCEAGESRRLSGELNNI
jgi:hypothetical protein